MGELRSFLASIQKEWKEIENLKRRITERVLEKPESTIQRLELEVDKKIDKIKSKLESSEKIRIGFLRLARRATQLINPGDFLKGIGLETDSFKGTLRQHLCEVTIDADWKIFFVLSSSGIYMDKNQAHLNFHIEYAKAQRIASRGETRLKLLCRTIADMHEIFYKYYTSMLHASLIVKSCSNYEEAKREYANAGKLSDIQMKDLQEKELFDCSVREIRNATNHHRLKYDLKCNCIEIKIEDGSLRQFKSPDLMKIIEGIRLSEESVYSIYSSSMIAPILTKLWAWSQEEFVDKLNEALRASKAFENSQSSIRNLKIKNDQNL